MDAKDDEIRYVYSLDWDTKTATWAAFSWLRENGKKPILWTNKKSAEDMARALCFNFNLAVVITSYIEIR